VAREDGVDVGAGVVTGAGGGADEASGGAVHAGGGATEEDDGASLGAGSGDVGLGTIASVVREPTARTAAAIPR
jgi:hypothetical protein